MTLAAQMQELQMELVQEQVLDAEVVLAVGSDKRVPLFSASR